MIKKEYFITTITVLIVIIVMQFIIIIINIRPFYGNEVTTPENAILIAKAALLLTYGESEIDNVEFHADRFGSRPNYWDVIALPMGFGNQPHVLVRVSDGKVKMRWTDPQLYFQGIVDSWLLD